MWTTTRAYSFAYSRRIWAQHDVASNREFYDLPCITNNKRIQGGEATIELTIQSEFLNDFGTIVDGNCFGWFDAFVKTYINRRVLIDLNDPWFVNITNTTPMWQEQKEASLIGFKPRLPLNTSDETYLRANPVYVPSTQYLAGYTVDTSELSGAERDFYDSFLFTKFIPTNEVLASWIWHIADAKLSRLNARVIRVDWCETQKIRSSYSV